MRAVAEDAEWQTRYRMSGEPAKTYQARDLLRQIAEATWACGDPGIQFDDTINSWHTCPEAGTAGGHEPVRGVLLDQRQRLQPRLAQPDAIPQ